MHKYNVSGANGTCLLASMGLQLNVTYRQEDNTVGSAPGALSVCAGLVRGQQDPACEADRSQLWSASQPRPDPSVRTQGCCSLRQNQGVVGGPQSGRHVSFGVFFGTSLLIPKRMLNFALNFTAPIFFYAFLLK